MFSHVPARRPLALLLALALSGVPALAAADEAPATTAAPMPASATPIADSAARAAVAPQGYYYGRRRSDAVKWTGFGLLAGGAGLIAVGAVLDDTDCFETDISRGDCRNARRGAFLAGGIMAGVGAGLLIMASHDRDGGRDRGRRRGRGRDRGRYTEFSLDHGRAVVQQQFVF